MPAWMMIWPDNPALSVIFVVVTLVLVMYGARTPAHRGIHGVARVITQGCRLTSEAIARLHRRVAARNREVLLSDGLERTERQIDYEFQQIAAVVDRDLGGYPGLHRKLSEQVAKIDEDYRRASDSPPAPEEWTQTLEAAGELVRTAGADTASAKAVGALHSTIEEAHRELLDRHRTVSRERHQLLSRMVPAWRSMSSTLHRVERSVGGIFERSRRLDELMSEYRGISARSDAAHRKLTSSTFTRFVAAGLVLVVASLGVFLNFKLISLPMSEMVGSSSRIGSMPINDVAALVVIMIQITMGLFLMESLRITRIFPSVGRLDAPMRRRVAWATFTVLLVFAGLESSLAYMRDLMVADRLASTQALAGAAVQPAEFLWIPSVGQMALGFMLPLSLTFVAIPLESFIGASRMVLGQVAVGTLRVLAFGVTMVGFVAEHVCGGVKNVYDLAIFLPLKVEELAFAKVRRDPKAPRAGRSTSVA